MAYGLFEILYVAEFRMNCLTIVGLVLVVYDYCLTFSMEVRVY